MSVAAPQEIKAGYSFWLEELPFTLVLLLTIVGVAYTSVSKHPIVVYWEVLAPIIGLLCVASGWAAAADRAARLRLIGTQLLHWSSFLVVMNLVLLPSVQKSFTANSTGLALFTLLTLGTFTAGVHVFSWQVCLLSFLMALAIPVISWVENSGLVLLLVSVGVLTLAGAVWWHWHQAPQRAELPE